MDKRLNKVGVKLIDIRKSLFECKKCCERWLVNIKTGGKYPNLYYICPNGCNEDKRLWN